MEMHLDVAGNAFSICCSTDLVNSKLAIAVVTIESTALTRNEHIAYSRLKTAALGVIADQLGVYPLVVEPHIPEAWSISPQRRQAAAKAATARST